MGKQFNQYFKERVVQIAVIAVIVKVLLTVLFAPGLSISLDQLITFALFGLVIIFIAHLMGKKITLLNLFLVGFFSILIFNQGIAMLKLIGAVPIMKDILVGVEMGLIIMIVGYLKGVKK